MPDLLKVRFEKNSEKLNYSPIEGHRERFIQKLSKGRESAIVRLLKSNYFWYSAAAAVLILLLFTVANQIKTEQQQAESSDLTDVSISLSEQAANYQMLISSKLSQIDKTNPNIQQNLLRLEKLESEYQKLKMALSQNFGNQKVILAMIQNYKNRLIILENMLIQIETIESAKEASKINDHA